MEVQMTRKTGFYGMASSLLIKKNQQKWFSINQNQTKTLMMSEPEATIQVSFFALKSKPLIIYNNQNVLFLEIKMNPIFISIYLVLFLAVSLVAYFKLSIFGVAILLLLYIVYFYVMLKHAYIIKEVDHGSKSTRFSE